MKQKKIKEIKKKQNGTKKETKKKQIKQKNK